jgi:hypothetical protein
VEFDLHGERLPAIGESVMRGRLAASDSGLDLTDIIARFGQSALQGRLSARFDATRPRIAAELQVSALDAALLSATGSCMRRMDHLLVTGRLDRRQSVRRMPPGG